MTITIILEEFEKNIDKYMDIAASGQEVRVTFGENEVALNPAYISKDDEDE